MHLEDPAPAPVAPDAQPIRASRRRLRRWTLRVVLALAALYLAWCTLLWFAQDRLIFPHQFAANPLPDNQIPANIERWWIDIDGSASGGGGAAGPKVEAWFAPLPGSSPEHPAGVAIVFHGNGEIIDQYRLSPIARWHARGYSVLLPEYRGYGRSAGHPSQAGIVRDMSVFYDRLVSRPDVDRARIVMHGRSLGTGVACQLAAIRPTGALLLDSPFSSIAEFAAGYFVPRFLVRSPFRSDLVLPGIDARGTPVLILHSPADEVVPYAHALRLHNLAPGSTLFILGGGHNDPHFKLDTYWEPIDALLAKAGLGPK